MDPLVVPSLQLNTAEKMSESRLAETLQSQVDSGMGDHTDSKSGSESKSKPPSNGDPLVIPGLQLISRTAGQNLPKSQLLDSELGGRTVDGRPGSESQLSIESKLPCDDGDHHANAKSGSESELPAESRQPSSQGD